MFFNSALIGVLTIKITEWIAIVLLDLDKLVLFLLNSHNNQEIEK